MSTSISNINNNNSGALYNFYVLHIATPGAPLLLPWL